MARKSSKTAHVLNLLAGHEEKKEPDSTTSSAPLDTTNVSIIDNSQKDDVEDLIQSKLLDEFGKELLSEEAETSESPVSEPVLETIEVLETPVLEPEPVSETPEALETLEIPAPEPVSEAPETPKALETPAPETVSEEEIKEEEAADFAYINIVEKIVRDKIIYYMRQFDCCTCDRCIADTVALTLNGLPPKYIVADPSAEAPLISYYTNKFISDITVEATKACMTIRENPRHKK